MHLSILDLATHQVTVNSRLDGQVVAALVAGRTIYRIPVMGETRVEGLRLQDEKNGRLLPW